MSKAGGRLLRVLLPVVLLLLLLPLLPWDPSGDPVTAPAAVSGSNSLQMRERSWSKGGRASDGVGPREASAEGATPEVNPTLDCLHEYVKPACFPPGATLEGPVDEALSDVRDGALLGAVRLAHMFWQCQRYPRTEHELATLVVQHWGLNRDSVYAFPESDVVRGRSPEPYDHQLSAALLREFVKKRQRCAPVYALIDNGYRGELSLMAAAGNEAAQLLFALWSPPTDASFEAFIEWQLTAEAYAQEGLRRARPLGSVAFSYGYLGTFAPHRFIVAWSHARAALACGFDARLLPPMFSRMDLEVDPTAYTQGLFALDARDEWSRELTAPCKLSGLVNGTRGQ